MLIGGIASECLSLRLGRRMLLLRNTLALFCALLAPNFFGQSAPSKTPSPASPQSRSHRRAMPGGERSMKGCVVKDPDGDYFLVPQHGRKVQLTPSADLSTHVGQQVKLSGAFIDAEAADPKPSGSPGAPSTADGKPHTIREFRVLKVDVLSAACPAAPPKKK